MDKWRSTEELSRWEPLPNLPTVLYCESITDTDKGLEILLASDDGETGVRLRFENPMAYQNVNETCRDRTWMENPSRGSTLLIVRNSRWVRWLVEESNSLLDSTVVTHYAIYTPEDCIDVVSRSPPKAELLPRHA